jgi:AcrR family transcriptional regulator
MKTTSKGANTKERLLSVALDLFLQQGYHGTTMRQIAEEGGITPGGIYNHFQNKDELFEQVINEYHPWLMIPEVVATAEGSTIEEFTHDAAHRLRAIWDESPDLMKLHHIETIEFQGVHLASLFERVFQKLTGVLEKIREQNTQFASIQIASISRAMLGLFFAYLATHRMPAALKASGFDSVTYDYLTDAYLMGVLTENK